MGAPGRQSNRTGLLRNIHENIFLNIFNFNNFFRWHSRAKQLADGYGNYSPREYSISAVSHSA